MDAVTLLSNRVSAVNASVHGLIEAARGLSPDVLDWVPPFAERRQTRASYCTPAALADVAGLHGVPVGVLLMRPAVSHVFHHAGEIELLIDVARSES